MIKQDLVLLTNTNTQSFAPNTSVQINRPNTFTNGGIFERAQEFRNLAIVGTIGVAGKRVFDAATDGYAKRTGRTDLQAKIDRGKKTFGTVTSLVGGFALGGGIGAANTLKLAVEAGIDFVEESKEREINQKNAEFRQNERSAIRDRSRSN